MRRNDAGEEKGCGNGNGGGKGGGMELEMEMEIEVGVEVQDAGNDNQNGKFSLNVVLHYPPSSTRCTSSYLLTNSSS